MQKKKKKVCTGDRLSEQAWRIAQPTGIRFHGGRPYSWWEAQLLSPRDPCLNLTLERQVDAGLFRYPERRRVGVGGPPGQARSLPRGTAPLVPPPRLYSPMKIETMRRSACSELPNDFAMSARLRPSPRLTTAAMALPRSSAIFSAGPPNRLRTHSVTPFEPG